MGSLLNNIQVSRETTTGTEVSRERVPLTYSPKEKYFYKLRQDLNHEERGPAVKLPRMSYDMIAMDYQPMRKSMSGRKICIQTDERGRRYTYSPTPYTLTFQFSIYTKSLDEMHQVVEQIVPSVAPEYTVAI